MHTKKPYTAHPGEPEGEQRRPVDVNELVESLIQANRERRQKAKDPRRRTRRKVQSVVDRLLTGGD